MIKVTLDEPVAHPNNPSDGSYVDFSTPHPEGDVGEAFSMPPLMRAVTRQRLSAMMDHPETFATELTPEEVEKNYPWVRDLMRHHGLID